VVANHGGSLHHWAMKRDVNQLRVNKREMKVFTGKVKVQVKSFFTVNDVIEGAINQINLQLGATGSVLLLENGRRAIRDHYELSLPDDEDTGEYDEDMPFFEKKLGVVKINQQIFVLLIINAEKVIKTTNGPLPHQNIDSIQASINASMIEKSSLDKSDRSANNEMSQ